MNNKSKKGKLRANEKFLKKVVKKVKILKAE